jgi:nicotinate-nucleotide adenylyltransferase
MARVKERLGIFGGTFDPPHIAHLILAAEALDQLGLERVLWVLTPDPPHKPDRKITPLPFRLEMLLEAVKDCPPFELSHIDIDRDPPHYALDTVHLLAGQHPDAELIYLMGGDSLRDLPAWHKPAEFIVACHALGVVRRPGERRLPGLSAKVRWIDAPRLEISASEIRRRAAQGRPYRFFLLPAVYEIILKRNLYRD